MFRNYFKIAFRNLLRYKVFSSINIFGLAALVISLLTISYRSWRAAHANPVKSLRYE